MLTKVFFLFAAVAGANAQTPVSQCPHNPGDLPLDVHLVGCETPPCLLPQLESAEFNILFRAPRTLISMRTLAIAYLNLGPITVPIPFDLGENAVTCNFLTNSTCPVLLGEIVSYQLRVFIHEGFPAGTQLTMEIQIVDASDTSSPIMCFRLPIQIETPSSTLEGPKDEGSDSNNLSLE